MRYASKTEGWDLYKSGMVVPNLLPSFCSLVCIFLFGSNLQVTFFSHFLQSFCLQVFRSITLQFNHSNHFCPRLNRAPIFRFLFRPSFIQRSFQYFTLFKVTIILPEKSLSRYLPIFEILGCITRLSSCPPLLSYLSSLLTEKSSP